MGGEPRELTGLDRGGGANSTRSSASGVHFPDIDYETNAVYAAS